MIDSPSNNNDQKNEEAHSSPTPDVETPTKLKDFFDDERFIAPFLSFGCPGLGQLYLKRYWSAAWQFGLVLCVAGYEAFINIQIIYRRNDFLRDLGDKTYGMLIFLGLMSAFLAYWQWGPVRRPIFIPFSWRARGWFFLFFFLASCLGLLRSWYFHDIDWTPYQVW
ncbi:MAG: hypothetical protein RIC16_08465 [Rhodospirillales bacterium]